MRPKRELAHLTELIAPTPAPLHAASPHESVTWSWLDGVIVFVGAFLIYFVGSVILVVIDYEVEHKSQPPFWVGTASYLWLTAGTYLMVGLWLVVYRRGTWKMVGFRLPARRSAARSIAWIAGVAFAGFILSDIISVVITYVVDLTPFHIRGNVKELLPKGQSTVTVSQFVMLIVLAGLLAPITEETLFRGALYQGILRSAGGRFGRTTGIVGATAIAGTVFGLAHLIGGSGELYTLPLLASLGMVLCLVFQYSDSLLGSMLLHSSVNTLAVATFYGARIH
jgi:membrane protease YdiL (CAAX protease family)